VQSGVASGTLNLRSQAASTSVVGVCHRHGVPAPADGAKLWAL